MRCTKNKRLPLKRLAYTKKSDCHLMESIPLKGQASTKRSSFHQQPKLKRMDYYKKERLLLKRLDHTKRKVFH